MRALPSYAEALDLWTAPTRTVPADHGDGNGHLNVRHYVGLFDDAEWELFDEIDAGHAASQAGVGGMFALEAFVTYRREVLVGDEVSVHLRLLARTERLLHFVSYLLDHTQGTVAASMEALEAYVDYGTRRISPFTDRAAGVLDERLARDTARTWAPELCGAISLTRSGE